IAEGDVDTEHLQFGDLWQEARPRRDRIDAQEPRPNRIRSRRLDRRRVHTRGVKRPEFARRAVGREGAAMRGGVLQHGAHDELVAVAHVAGHPGGRVRRGNRIVREPRTVGEPGKVPARRDGRIDPAYVDDLEWWPRTSRGRCLGYGRCRQNDGQYDGERGARHATVSREKGKAMLSRGAGLGKKRSTGRQLWVVAPQAPASRSRSRRRG